MTQTRNLDKTKKIQPSISQQMWEKLKLLAENGGIYGKTPTAVATYLIQRGLDDLQRTNVFNTINESAQKQKKDI